MSWLLAQADTGSHYQVLIPVTLIIGAFLMPLVSRWFTRFRSPLVLLTTSLALLMAIALFYFVTTTSEGFLSYFPGHSWSGSRFLSTGEPIGIEVRTDIFSAFMVLLITAVGLLVAIYSLGYAAHEVPSEKLGYYYTLYLLLIAGMAGIVLAGDYFNFYVLLEVTTIASYALVAIGKRREGVEAAFKYLMAGGICSILIVMGIGMIYGATGSLNMHFSALRVETIMTSGLAYISQFRVLLFASLSFLTIAFSIKAGMIPVHAWLPDAHSVAPSSVSALLSGIFIKVTGLYLIIHLWFTVFGVQKGFYGPILPTLILLFSAVTIIGGSLLAIAQTDLKRMLAYSSVAQVGYILLGIGLLNKIGLTSAILHIFNHSIMKSTLFLSAGSIIYVTGIREINKLNGIGRRMPVTMAAFSVASIAMVGIPPTNGFLSKWYLLLSSLEADQIVMAVIIILSSLLNAVYYLRIIIIAYFGELEEEVRVEESPWTMLVPVSLLGLSNLLLGIFTPVGLFNKAAGFLFLGR